MLRYLYGIADPDAKGPSHLLGTFDAYEDLYVYMKSIDHLLPPHARQWRTVYAVPHNPESGVIDEQLLAAIKEGGVSHE